MTDTSTTSLWEGLQQVRDARIIPEGVRLALGQLPEGAAADGPVHAELAYRVKLNVQEPSLFPPPSDGCQPS